MRRTLTAIAFVATFVLSPVISASPWVADRGEFITSARFDFQSAQREFLEDREARPYPLNGSYRAAQVVPSLRFGLVDNLELEFQMPLKVASYTSDPVILLPNEDGGLDYYQNNAISLSETVAGASDFRATGRYQIVDGRFATALALGAKIPTGYDRPAGTFGREPASAQDFKENIASYVQPENVQDDVTLGSGQVDLDGKVLFGWVLPTRTYLRADTGYRLRFRGGGDQVLGRLKIGQVLHERVLVHVTSGVEYAIEDGDVIGISVQAKNPELPANEYGGTKNLELHELRLDYDRATVGAGVILRITERVEGTVDYRRVVWGRNTSLTNTLSMGLGVRFDALPGPDG